MKSFLINYIDYILETILFCKSLDQSERRLYNQICFSLWSPEIFCSMYFLQGNSYFLRGVAVSPALYLNVATVYDTHVNGKCSMFTLVSTCHYIAVPPHKQMGEEYCPLKWMILAQTLVSRSKKSKSICPTETSKLMLQKSIQLHESTTSNH